MRRVHFHDSHADGPDGVIVLVARLLEHDHVGLEPDEDGELLHLFGIAAGHAGGGGMGQRAGAAGRNDGGLRTHPLGKTLAGLLHQFVEVQFRRGRFRALDGLHLALEAFRSRHTANRGVERGCPSSRMGRLSSHMRLSNTNFHSPMRRDLW